MAETFGSVGRKFEALSKQMSGPGMRKTLTAVGESMQKQADTSARADLGGDNKFSGWSSPLTTRIKLGATEVTMLPTPRGAGPWTVAERGRNADGGAGGFQGPAVNRRTGNTVRTKTGGFRNSRARGRKWNGRTAGKGTATTAVARIKTEVPKVVEKHLVTETLRSAGLA